MKRFVCMVLFAIASVAAFASTTRMASEDWVRKNFLGIGVRISTSTVTTNANGTITYRCPYANPEVPTCRFVYFTFGEPTITSRVQRVQLKLWNLFVPVAYAQEGGDPDALTITLTQGGWVADDGTEYAFDFAGDTLEYIGGYQMPEVPDTTHTCSLNGDCNCVDSVLSAEELETNAKTEYPSLTTDQLREFYSKGSWFDLANWPDNLKRTRGGNTTYYAQDINGNFFDLDGIVSSDAFADGLAYCLEAVNDRIDECRDAYKDAHTCEEENPQHEWTDKTCGNNTWKVCQNNPAHTQGTAQHDTATKSWVNNGAQHKRTCSCGEKTETEDHNVQEGSKQWNEDHNKWTRTDSCTKCQYARTTTHNCVHIKCAACSGGDGCNAPCTCNGEHDFKFNGTGKCKRCHCKCAGNYCKGTEYELFETRTRENHTGWKSCGLLEDDVNTRSGGDHCCCECGDYSHDAGTTHTRDNVANYREQIGDDEEPDNTQFHWLVKKSRCNYCNDPYGEIEAHQFEENQRVSYEYVDNETHQKKIACKLNCGYKKNSGDPVGHSKGDDLRWEYVSDDEETGCREWSTCPSVGGCGKLWSEDIAHVRSTVEADECKCVHCKTYQFEHDYSYTDECGNTRCSYCMKIDPTTAEQHKYANGNLGASGHPCLCGRGPVQAHVWGEPYAVETDGGTEQWHDCTEGPDGVCGYKEVIAAHTCEFTNCACKICKRKCLTCGGEHVFEGEHCHQCTCENCTVTPDDKEQHNGWHECGEDDEDNDDGSANGGHCACHCLKFGHDDGNPHQYNPQQIEKKTPRDESCHWRAETCKKCGHHHAKDETHHFPQKPESYEYVNDNQCRWHFVCEDCGEYMDEDNHTHVKDTDNVTYADVVVDGAHKCRATYPCKNCKRAAMFTEDGEHLPDPDNFCKCMNGCGYQLEHSWIELDACSNRVCALCDYHDPEHTDKHIGCVKSADGLTHHCNCGKVKERDHIWGEPVILEQSDDEVTWVQYCVNDQWNVPGVGCHASRTWTTPKSTWEKTGEYNCACGCDCHIEIYNDIFIESETCLYADKGTFFQDSVGQSKWLCGCHGCKTKSGCVCCAFNGIVRPNWIDPGCPFGGSGGGDFPWGGSN